MGKLDSFKLVFIGISAFITILIGIAIFSLFTVIPFRGFIDSLLSEEMLFSIKLSFTTALISSFFVMITAIPTGYSLSRFDFFGKTFVKTIADLPIAFPQLVLGLCLIILFGSQGIGNFLERFGIQVEFTKLGIIIAQYFTALPFSIKIIKSTFDHIDPHYEFISRSFGYNGWLTFKNISLPLAKKGILASTITTFARCMGSFGAVLILAGGTRMKTEVLSVALYLNFSYGNINMAITAGILIILISFIVIFIIEKIEVHT